MRRDCLHSHLEQESGRPPKAEVRQQRLDRHAGSGLRSLPTMPYVPLGDMVEEVNLW